MSPAALTLRAVRRMLEGVLPPAICSLSEDGMPHLSHAIHVEVVDDAHVALTFQFSGRSRENLLATRRVALCVEDPLGGGGVVLRLQYLRTDTDGPIVERLRAKLAGVAAHAGMDQVFRLRGADVYRVEAVEPLDPGHAPGSMAPRCDLAAGVSRLGRALAEAADVATLLRLFLDGLQQELRIDHAIVWMLDEERQGLYSLGSLGYEHPGTGAELPLARAGLAGVAVRERTTVRIGQMGLMLAQALKRREQALHAGQDEAVRPPIPLPGLARPRSQIAVPLRARGRAVGALLVESDLDQFFSYDDEDALAAVAAALALGLSALPAADVPDEQAAPPLPEARTAEGPPLRIRHYPRDHSVFVGDDYLIRGVAGAILARVVRQRIASGNEIFTTRELRLAGDELRLPDVQDNLGVRLLMLERRLAERDFGLHIERVQRGRYRLRADGPLEIVVGDAAAAG